MSAAAGVRAITTPARTAAGVPNGRRTARNRTPTLAIPSRAWGRRTDHELRPRIRTLRAMSQTAAGGLSRVMKLPASSEPKKNAPQSLAAAWAAIA